MSAGGEQESVLVVRRVLPARREDVFAAWLDARSLARWMCPGAVTRATAEIDPRVGGRFRIVMHGPRDYEHHGEYLRIDPPSALSFTWISEGTDRQPTVVTVELFERGLETELVLTHRRLPAARVEPHTRGWSDIVARLEEEIRCGS